MNSFTTSFTVAEGPMKVFDAINHVRGWWSGEVAGTTDALGARFTYRVPNVHFCEMEVVESVPGKRVAWLVRECTIEFVNAKHEWKGTKIVFDIAPKDGKTELRFTHEGLEPAHECYDACSNGWSALISRNLRNLTTTGRDQPSPWA